MAQTGLARAISPVHTPLDGDVVFALATGQDQDRTTERWPPDRLAQLGNVASTVMARAVARGVYHAAPVPDGWRGPAAWHTEFGAPTRC